MRIAGQLMIDKFGRKHADARKPLDRFLQLARAATWANLTELKSTFPAADYAPTTGTVIFDIGGNKYRLIARADFEEQLLVIMDVLTHAQYDREKL